MKILFVITALGLAGGGAERVLAEVGSALARRGHEVIVASFDPDDAADFYPLDPAVARRRLGRSGWRAIRRIMREQRPDATIGMMASAYLPLAAAAAATGRLIVASEHTAFAHYHRRPLLAALMRLLAPRFAAITVPSERVRAGFPPGLLRRMTVIPNPVAPGDARSAPRARAGKVLLAVGNLRPEKGHRTLVDAFAIIAAANPGWQLRIVGDGPERGALERQVKRLGLSGRVTLAGTVREIAREYAAADLFVMPSRYESFGLATAEALAAGLPAIGFADCPGTNELICDGVNGRLVVGPDRVQALADGLAQLMADAALRSRLGAAGPGSVAQYSLASVTDQWEYLLRSLTGG